jgi:ketosteroid isomerase-like protein
VRLSFLSPQIVAICAAFVLIMAYYLSVRRPASTTTSNSKLSATLKILVLVCLSCIAILAFYRAATSPANHPGARVSLTYFAVPTVSASPKATADTLKQLEAELMKASAEKGSQGYMSYYAEDAVEVPNGALIITGKANIAQGMGFLDEKNNQLIWTPVGGDISASADLGYTYGNYEFHSKNKEGQAVVEYGKYTSIWKLQKDGRWKVVLDMGNSSPHPKA